jgi:hypothetical protein
VACRNVPCAPAPDRLDLRRGVECFNRGEYFEAHEAWEAVWLRTRGPLAEFYKGLVQCAAALHHLRRGNAEGARRLHARQRVRLAAFAPRTLGVPVARLLADMDALFASPPTEPDAVTARGPRTDAGARAMPTIALDDAADEPPGAGPPR